MPGKRIGGWSLLLMLLAIPLSAAPKAVGSLLESVRAGDHAAVRTLLRQHADANAAEKDGTTALARAVQRDDLEMVTLLIKAGADAQRPNRYRATPLAVAVANGNPAITAALLKAGADPNAPALQGEPPLLSAARTGNPKVVTELLDYGADVDGSESWRGQTALMWAAAENNVEAMRVLADRGAEVNRGSKVGFTALAYAVRAGQREAVMALLEAGAAIEQPASDGTGPLVLAILNVNYELAALLLDRGADPNADAQGWTALHQIALTRRPSIGGFNNPEPLQKGTLDSLELVRRLIAKGADPNRAATKEPKTGLNSFNRIGASPFLLAARAADTPMMRLLVDLGADPKLTNVDGTTALMTAAGVGIFTSGDDPSTNDEALDAVKFAFDLGLPVTTVDKNAETALHGAAYRGANELVQFLVDRGARFDVVNKKGWTPLTIADGVVLGNTFKRQPDTAVLLRKLMGDVGLPVPPDPHRSGDARSVGR